MRKTYTKKKKEILSKFYKLNFNLTSILKLTIALALFLMAALFISGAGVIVENGALNVSNSLLVSINTLYADSSSNRVGINTTSPQVALDVKGDIAVRYPYALILQGTGGGYNRALWNDPNNNFNFTNTNNDIFIGGQGASTLFIRGSTQTVGIGLSNPIFPLHIQQASDSQSQGFSLQNTVGQNYIQWVDSSGTARYDSGSDGSRNFAINGLGAGKVGIGTANPSHALHVVGSENLTGTLYYGALQAQSPHAFVERDSDGNLKPTTFCIVTSQGNVLQIEFTDSAVLTLLGINTTECMNKQTLETEFDPVLNRTVERRRYVFR